MAVARDGVRPRGMHTGGRAGLPGIARLTTRFPRIVLAVAFALAVLFGIVGATASAHMKSGGFT
ncbi:hypothetical protein, partial [Nocardia cyriacigeorgica]|uniref:hypothetical protein n=1 Tax=Nocardia cyriacigeorgica TaxID=135487 RepID=UPI002454A0EE